MPRITGSQKGFMLPAGLGILAMSQRALAKREQAKCARVFFDLGRHDQGQRHGYFPYTPSIPLLYGLRESLDMLSRKDWTTWYARHHRLAEGCRKAVAAWGLTVCAKQPKWNSDTVTAVMVPQASTAQTSSTSRSGAMNLALGAGLSEMAGKLFRIGHLGDLNELMCSARSRGRRWRCGTPAFRYARHRRRRRAGLLPVDAAPLAARAGAPPSGVAPRKRQGTQEDKPAARAAAIGA